MERPHLNVPSPGGRTCPPEVLAALREIHPDAELIYMGKGMWTLGRVQPDADRRARAIRILDGLYGVIGQAGDGDFFLDREKKVEIAAMLWRNHLRMRGFRFIATYEVEGWPGSRIVEDLRARWYNYQNRFREIERTSLGEADTRTQDERRIEQLHEYLELEHKRIHRHAFRHPESVVVGSQHTPEEE